MIKKAFWRDSRFLQILAQVVFVIALAIVAGGLYSNVRFNLNRLGLAVGYNFLRNPASFDIGEAFIPYRASNSYGYALIVGFVNTLVVSAVGILITTVLGVLAGIARLSTNLLIRKLAGAYVGVIRNTPLLIQLMFWYFGVILQLPNVRQAVALPGSIYLTKRGVFMPWPVATSTYANWVPFIWIAGISILVIWVVFALYTRRTNRSIPLYFYQLFLVVPAIILLLGAGVLPHSPLEWSIPALSGLNFKGGKPLTPEFTALLVGLVVYTGAFIAEVVRAGIQAVSKGQAEAARSVGLNSSQTLRLVILPQALRVIIPPMTSQYLNLAKNSSLAIAIGYPDLFSIAGTVFNQTGAAIEIIVIMMLSYLSMSLFTSMLMNIYNNRMRLVER